MCFELLRYTAGHRLPIGKLLKVQIGVWAVAPIVFARTGAESLGSVRRSVGLCSGRSPRNWFYLKNRVRMRD